MNNEKEHLKLTTVLFRAMQNVEAVIRNDISSYQLNTSEFGVLELLYNRGKQPIQSIANRLLMANSSMTYVIDKLEQKKMISRTTDEVDRRSTMIDLTLEGQQFFNSIFPNHVHTLSEIYKCLSKEELTNLIESLKKIGYQAMDMNGAKK
jgi:MarR family transcriptional regulator, 2-MHQ and catechol-resistance regulon repressor